MPRFFRAGPRPVHILLIVDASGSMAGYQEKVMEGVNGFFHRLAEEAGDYLVTLIQFSGPYQIETCASRTPVAQAALYYRADGGTALWDGVARGFQVLEATGPDPVVCLVLTDGHENGSREYTQPRIHAEVQTRLWSGTWTFLWLNMQGSENANAKALGIECLDFSREDISRVLAELACNLGQSVARMRMEGGRAVAVAGLLGRRG